MLKESFERPGACRYLGGQMPITKVTFLPHEKKAFEIVLLLQISNSRQPQSHKQSDLVFFQKLAPTFIELNRTFALWKHPNYCTKSAKSR